MTAIVPEIPTAPSRSVARPLREQYGRSLRDIVRRVDHDKWIEGERDVIGRIKGSEQGRIAELLPFRHGRMAQSPFAFLRGSAAVMAPDLMALPTTGYCVQICGDAHVRNLGAYSAPDGRIVFDVNDFDETTRAPWEWDLKRLAVSFVVVARESSATDGVARDAVMELVRSWREALHELADLPAYELPRYTVHRFASDGAVGRVLAKAERMSPTQACDELAAPGPDARPRFVPAPPKIHRVPDAEAEDVLESLAMYRTTVGPSRVQVLDCYEAYDVAFKVAGTGSIGGRNYVVMCAGNGPNDSLVLQVKQALPSSFELLGWNGGSPSHGGQRVATGQHRMQTSVDPFVGWTTIDGTPFYVRQLSDHKASIDPADLKRSSLLEYARVCGETFGKVHARTADAAVLYGYAGQAEKLDRAFAKMALVAADQVTRDWELLVAAIAKGDLASADMD
ncbi:MAG TPA: DUF2252 domain-containing protein [Kofleriaceae bacterium]|jgi:uncharacterized protein (DUF2252 family)